VFTQYRVPRPPSLRWVHGESFSMRTTTSGEHLACTHTMPSTTTMLPSLESSIVYNIPKPSLGVNAVSIHNPTQPNPIQQISRNISLLLSREDSISLTQSWNLGIYLRYRQDWTFTTTTLHRMFRSKVSLLDLSLSLKLSILSFVLTLWHLVFARQIQAAVALAKPIVVCTRRPQIFSYE